MIAFAKLQGLVTGAPFTFPFQKTREPRRSSPWRRLLSAWFATDSSLGRAARPDLPCSRSSLGVLAVASPSAAPTCPS